MNINKLKKLKPPISLEDAIKAFRKYYDSYNKGNDPKFTLDDSSFTDQVSIKKMLSRKEIEFQKEANGLDFLDAFIQAIYLTGLDNGKRFYEHYELESKLLEAHRENMIIINFNNKKWQ